MEQPLFVINRRVAFLLKSLLGLTTGWRIELVYTQKISIDLSPNIYSDDWNMQIR